MADCSSYPLSSHANAWSLSSPICLYKGCGRNIAFPPFLLQFVKQVERILAPARSRIGPHEYAFYPRASMRDNKILLEHWDCFPGSSISDENKAEIPKSGRLIGFHRECGAQLPLGVLIAARKKQDPGKIGGRYGSRVEFAAPFGSIQGLVDLAL